jgi:hypothetical protein
VQQTGGSTQCLSIEDEGNPSEAISRRRVGGPSQSELGIVGSASLIPGPMGVSGVEDGRFER